MTPFSWFGEINKSLSADAESGRRHARKVSLSSSSSPGGQRARLADARAKTRTSYLRKDVTQSGDLSTSRSSRISAPNTPTRKPIIVAVEPDVDDSKRGRRIDQGLLDASKEAQNQVLEPPNKSWWASFSSIPPPPLPPLSPPQAPWKNTDFMTPKTEAKLNTSAATKHRRTVSYNKTYRVP
mmetsp:Transcript_38472/g.69343  ORF Transcript_38472/g.69343 Transcript_38472/m.69343 type:complete len:182 (+) Transcript_38472:72-617(+)